MAKAVADTDSPTNQGGFAPDGSNITGFSNMHDSGTGGNPSLGNFPFFPYSTCVNDTVNGCVYPKMSRRTQYDNSSLQASPGYFALTLNSGISAEMTTAQHTSLIRFRFPPRFVGNGSDAGGRPLILMDLTDLSDSRQNNATVSIDAETGRMTGSSVFLPSFGSGNYTLCYCADFSGSAIRDNGIWVNTRASTDVKDLKVSRGINQYPLPAGGFVRFQPSNNPVSTRMGLSFISSYQACCNAEKDIPDFDFDGTRAAAVDAWRSKLSPIQVSTNGVNPNLTKTFYSGIYRTMVSPQNYTGENSLWQSAEPYFDSFYWQVLALKEP